MVGQRPKKLPPERGGRHHVVRVFLSDLERDRIKARAGAAGVTMQRLMVESCANRRRTASERQAQVEELLFAERAVCRLERTLQPLVEAAERDARIPVDLLQVLLETGKALERLAAAASALGADQ